MKRLLIGTTCLFWGCAFNIPDIGSQYPQGYSKLVDIVPDCSKDSLANYHDRLIERIKACSTASRMLESSPERATVELITFWERTSLLGARSPDAVVVMAPPMSSGVMQGIIATQEFKAMNDILIPTLRQVYRSSPGDYSKMMLPNVDLIVSTSKSSFESFKEVHTKALTK